MNPNVGKFNAASRRMLVRLAALSFVALAVTTLISACGSPSGGEEAEEAQSALIEEAWGIRVLSVALTAGGGMVDVRYQVTNPEKAALALGSSEHDVITPEDVKESPLLIDEESGYAFMETHLHLMGRVFTQRENPKAGVSRFMLFSNMNGLIRPGDSVSLAIGDRRLVHMVVQ